MLRTPFTSLLMVLGTSMVFSQQPTPKPTLPTCNFSEIYKADGWTVPGLLNARVKKRATLSNIPGVTVTIFEPVQPETTITAINCSRDLDGRLEIEELPIKILELSAYEYKGRAYAYGLSYERQAIQNGARVPLGAASGFLYYDLHDSGRFTMRKWAKWPFVPNPPPNAPNS